MKTFSAKYLPRDLKIIGSILTILSFSGLLLHMDLRNPLSLLIFFVPLIIGASYFALASGVSKKEKWAWVAGLIFFGLLIIYNLPIVLLGVPLPLVVIGILIPAFFLFTFIKGSKEIAINPVSNIFPLVLTSIGILLVLSSIVLLIYLVLFPVDPIEIESIEIELPRIEPLEIPPEIKFPEIVD